MATTKTHFIIFVSILFSFTFVSVTASSCDSSRYPRLLCRSLLASENYFSERQDHRHHNHRHHHHNHHSHHRPPPEPVPATSSTPNQPSPRDFPTPSPPPPETRRSVPDVAAEGRHSLTDVIKGLRRSKGRLHIPGLQGNGILVGDALIVSKDGTGDFLTIGEAVEAVPENIKAKDGYFVIYVKRGVYEEYIDMSRYKTNVLLLGDGINETVITGNHSNALGWDAYHSATFAVHGEGFIGIGVTFRNTYGPGSQAAAVRNRADQSAFFRCSFEGYQDTLYAHSGTQFYRECHVYGSIDFIFGNAAAVFQKCHVLARSPGRGRRVVVTAQGRESGDEKGATSFHNCTVDAAEPGVGPAFLGRPWKAYARVAFLKSYLGEMVDPAGWSPMEGVGIDDAYYGEYGNYGPGSDTSHRVTWPGVSKKLSDSEAGLFTVYNLTDGGSWLPRTDIPFSLGIEPLI